MEKSWKLLKTEFGSELVYSDDDDKYIKTKIKIYDGGMITNFQSKKLPKEKAPCKCFTNNVRFCYQSKEEVLSSNTFGRM